MGTLGYAWSSSPSSASSVYGSNLSFYGSGVFPEFNYYRAYGFPVRCARQQVGFFDKRLQSPYPHFAFVPPGTRAGASENFLFGGRGGWFGRVFAGGGIFGPEPAVGRRFLRASAAGGFGPHRPFRPGVRRYTDSSLTLRRTKWGPQNDSNATLRVVSAAASRFQRAPPPPPKNPAQKES